MKRYCTAPSRVSDSPAGPDLAPLLAPNSYDGADRENATPAVAEVEAPSLAKSEFCADPEAFFRLLYQPGDVWELCAFNCPAWSDSRKKRTASGYFDDPSLAAKWAKILDTTWKPPGVYCTLNPVLPDLLGRSHNKIDDEAANTTTDEQIVCRRWLPLNIDPARPAGVSATYEEAKAAIELGIQIRDELAGSAWPKPLMGMSGNGSYLLYRVDLPNNDDATDLIQRVLHGLANRFGNATAKIDRSTFNASQIITVLGTKARKGHDFAGSNIAPARRHRLTHFWPPDGELLTVPVELLNAVAAKPEEMRPPTHRANGNA